MVFFLSIWLFLLISYCRTRFFINLTLPLPVPVSVPVSVPVPVPVLPCGKGTQCAKVVQEFSFTHLSAGELLRAEIKSGSELGVMIQRVIVEGRIVPSEITVKLLCKAMEESGNDKFLIDGFPRNEENRIVFENVAKIEPAFVLFFDCHEEEMEKRIMNRNQGREDDNVETIKKRFKVFIESSLPVVRYYESQGKLRKIDAAKPSDAVFKAVKDLFSSYET